MVRYDTGQQIPYFDRCQLIITWMSDIKEVHGKASLHVSVNLLGTLSNRRRRPDDGNRKRDISFETTLRMYKTL